MTLLGPDISHAQGAVDFAKIKAAGNTYVVLKATEGVGFVDPMFAANRRAAHAAGLIVGIYHFSRDNAPTAEAAYFAGVVGLAQTNEFLVLDQEVVHSIGNVAWSQTWLDVTRAHFGIAPFIYLNKGNSTGVTSGNWTTVAQTYGLWLASYDNAPATQTAVPYWGVPAMKQYTDKGSCPGVAGAVDLDVFYGTTAQLLAYCKPSGGTVATADDVWNYTVPARNGVGPASAATFLSYIGDFVTQAIAWEKASAAKIDALTAAVAQLAEAVAASPGMTCQGNPQAVLTALGEKLATPGTST